MTEMHPFWLSFRNQRLEDKFLSDTGRRAIQSDKALLIFAGCMRVLVASRVYLNGDVDRVAEIAFYSAPVLGEFVLRNVLESRNPELLVKWRSAIVCISRCCIIFFFGKWVPGLLMQVAASDKPLPFITCLLWMTFCSGVQVHVGLSFGLPLPFTQHVVLQAISIVFMIALVKENYCMFARSIEMRDAASTIALVHEILALSGLRCGDPVAIHEIGKLSKLDLFCPQLLVFFNVFWGGLVFSYILWRSERGKRLGFLKSIKRESDDAYLLGREGNDDEIMPYVILALGLPLMACVWGIIGWVVQFSGFL